MKNRLTDTRRASLENRLLKLRAYLEPGKVGKIVDAVSPDQVDIQPILDKIIKLMEGDEASTSIKEVKKAKLQTALLKMAFEMGADEDAPPAMPPKKPMPPVGQPPMAAPMPPHGAPPAAPMDDDGSADMPMDQPPLQSMDDESLMEEIKTLELLLTQHLQQQQGGDAPAGPTDAPPMDAPKDASENEDDQDNENQNDDSEEDDKMPKLAPEQKMALLMSLPAEARAKKAASLRALAGALDSDIRPVSQNNDMTGNEGSALSDHYEKEDEGSMTDVKAALQAKVASLIQAAEQASLEADGTEGPEAIEAKASAEVVGLALRHLYAAMGEDPSQEGPPSREKDVAEDSDEDGESADDVDEKMEEKKAILKARLASLRRTANSTADPHMKTPKEVPSPSGTTEDNLKGDAPIRYQNVLGGESLDVAVDKRQKVPTDKTTAGDANSNYFKSSPSAGTDRLTSETDSSKNVTNKRTLKNMENATQSAEPASPNEQLVHNDAGSHQKTKDWEKAKSESDITPGGPRLVGLAQVNEMVKERTGRAMTLAGKMANSGMLKTEAHFQEQVIKLASMDDDSFEKIAEFFESIPKTAGEIPPQFEKHKNGPEFKAHEGDPDDEKPPFEDDEKHEAAARNSRRVARRNENDEEGVIRQVASQKTASNGIKRPLYSGIDNIPTAKGSPIFNKVASIDWTDAITAARSKTELDDLFLENRPR